MSTIIVIWDRLILYVMDSRCLSTLLVVTLPIPIAQGSKGLHISSQQSDPSTESGQWQQSHLLIDSQRHLAMLSGQHSQFTSTQNQNTYSHATKNTHHHSQTQMNQLVVGDIRYYSNKASLKRIRKTIS